LSIHRKKEDSGMSIGRAGALMKSTSHPDSSLAFDARGKPAFLGIDRIVDDLSAILTRAGAKKVETTVPDRTVRLAIDGEDMDEAFATLSNAVARGAAVTVHGNLVEIETGENEGDRGCALLSVSITGGQRSPTGHDGKTAVRDALSAVREVTKRHSGFLRLWTRRGEMRFTLYLPVLHG
jgi:hypothetical protein